MGCGVMGTGIARLCAFHGHSVTVVERDKRQLEAGLTAVRDWLFRRMSKGALDRPAYDSAIGSLEGSEDLDDLAISDLVIEAIAEELPAKAALFRQLGQVCGNTTVLASNTSSLSITALAASSGCPEQVVGLHFFNPPTVMRLVEVVTWEGTSGPTIESATAFCVSIDRVPVRVKDSPGFIANRLLIPFLFDAVRLVEADVATAEDIDRVCREGLGHSMGPLATADLIGLDTLSRIGESLLNELKEDRFQPPESILRLVAAGRLGQKSGSGLLLGEKTDTPREDTGPRRDCGGKQ